MIARHFEKRAKMPCQMGRKMTECFAESSTALPKGDVGFGWARKEVKEKKED